MFRIAASSLSLLAWVSVTACASPPPELDVSLMHSTVDKKFIVAVIPPTPPPPPPINQMHAWQIKLSSPNGMPITHALITVDGGMPQYGHGLPTRPQVTRELADGTYLLEGMKFSMTGRREIKLAIQTPEGSDKVTFNAVVTTPATVR